MGVRIEAIPDSCRLKLSGDVETTVTVPYEDDDRFMVGLSDGTLLIGSYDEALCCHFDVARHGAGFVRIGDGTALVEWHGIEWAAVSTYDANIVERPEIKPLPLFPDIETDKVLN